MYRFSCRVFAAVFAAGFVASSAQASSVRFTEYQSEGAGASGQFASRGWPTLRRQTSASERPAFGGSGL